MKKVLSTLFICFISVSAVANEIPHSMLESQLGVRKSYEGIDEVIQYVTFGGNLLIKKLELIGSKGDQVQAQLHQGNFSRAHATAMQMSSERLAYKELREKVKDEFSSILRNFFQPGLDSRNDDVAEVYGQISAPYIIVYDDFLFRSLGYTGRQIDSGSQGLVSVTELYVRVYDTGMRDFPIVGAISKVEEIQIGLDEMTLVIRNFLNSINESE